MEGILILAATNTGRHGEVDSVDNYDGTFSALMQHNWRSTFLPEGRLTTAWGSCRRCAPQLMAGVRRLKIGAHRMAEATEFRTFGEMVSVLAHNTPHALILDWWRRLDRAIDYYFGVRGIRRPSSIVFVNEVLASDARVGSKVTAQVTELRRVRNVVAHEDTKPISPDEAARYAQKSLELIRLIATDPPAHSVDGGSESHVA